MEHKPTAQPPTIPGRVRVDGKFFRQGEHKFYVKGITYGPLAPGEEGTAFAGRRQTGRDFELLRELGVNVLRLYEVPPAWFLDLAQTSGFFLLVDVPWNQQIAFLDSAETRREVVETVRQAAASCARHPAVLALSVGNEIPPDIVRWSGVKRVAAFLDELAEVVRQVAPDCLCTYGNFPPTEFLRPGNLDFVMFNVYLHDQRTLEQYLYRLQTEAGSQPLLLGEFGMDSLREGEVRKCHTLSWSIETAFRTGLAGTVVFSFTDDWHRGGTAILDWNFGLTEVDRKPKESYWTVRNLYRRAPHFPLNRIPLVSVVVAVYNGARTLELCLNSLTKLNYPAYEVILIDDGSTDQTPRIAARFTSVRYFRHASNLGLSCARNTGWQAARGEIIAYTDADCRADEDWLYYTVGELLRREDWAGVGGHNFLPLEDSWVAAAVMVSPGGPAHVMLTDQLAEHIPGCNMVFHRWALEAIGGFDPLFRIAGDDVDVCWRLQQRGFQIGFHPGGFVWHFRRSTVADYVKQQRGYGEAEALLVYRHPEHFNWFGASQWQGRIYSPANYGVFTRTPIVYHGIFASGFFQSLYAPGPSSALMLLLSLEYHAFVTLPLLVLATMARPLLPLAVTAFLLSVTVAVAAAWQADLPPTKKKFRSRPLVAFLFFLQPIVRGWARYRGQFGADQPSSLLAGRDTALEADVKEVSYWSNQEISRVGFLTTALEDLDQRGWQNKADAGWDEFDIEIYGSRWTCLRLVTSLEVHAGGVRALRCRLEPDWTPVARVVFWFMVGLELTVVGLFGKNWPWLWLLLASLPLFGAWLAIQQRQLRRRTIGFLNQVAEKMGLVRAAQGGRNDSEPRSP